MRDLYSRDPWGSAFWMSCTGRLREGMRLCLNTLSVEGSCFHGNRWPDSQTDGQTAPPIPPSFLVVGLCTLAPVNLSEWNVASWQRLTAGLLFDPWHILNKTIFKNVIKLTYKTIHLQYFRFLYQRGYTDDYSELGCNEVNSANCQVRWRLYWRWTDYLIWQQAFHWPFLHYLMISISQFDILPSGQKTIYFIFESYCERMAQFSCWAWSNRLRQWRHHGVARGG